MRSTSLNISRWGSELQGVILSAGLGTRLRPLTAELPKPLVPVAGRPLIEWGLIALIEAGIHTVGINTHYRAEALLEHFSSSRFSASTPARLAAERGEELKLHFSHEPELLGTGGGVRALWDLLDSIDRSSMSARPNLDLLCLNGDAFFDFELISLIKAHYGEGDERGHLNDLSLPVGTLALREVPPEDPFGRVGVDASGRVVRIAEVEGPRAREEVRVGAFTGAQIITPAVINHLEPCWSDIFRVAHRELLDQDAEIRAHFVPSETLWVDVGTPERHAQAHDLLDQRPQSSLWRHVPHDYKMKRI